MMVVVVAVVKILKDCNGDGNIKKDSDGPMVIKIIVTIVTTLPPIKLAFYFLFLKRKKYQKNFFC